MSFPHHKLFLLIKLFLLLSAWSHSPAILNTAAGLSQAVLVKAALFYLFGFIRNWIVFPARLVATNNHPGMVCIVC